ncbi:hypothetical protein SAMN06295945_0108 [Polynucleobacter meluiroseus]|uniref:Lipoprotein n=1 Tax=Polynucleobacter meluiroseus TaxID=1938814 RepID=A0A240DXZ1_9BURK|nr:hypothetical protein [Polynucleobacter meluiroseus]SNX27792.1 hypothetical protein SAMN06295945_0108 [Polynucleobacter meluiroseus]
MRSCIVIATSILLIACSPKLDWRTVQAPQESFTALFPGKPDKLERQVPYQGANIPQILEAVKVDEAIYSVSSIYLNKDQSDFFPELLKQMQDNLFKRAGVDAQSALSSSAVYRTVARQRQPTTDYFLDFIAPDSKRQSMRVRWISRPSPDGGIWVYQVSVLQNTPSGINIEQLFSEEQYATFFEEFHPE